MSSAARPWLAVALAGLPMAALAQAGTGPAPAPAPAPALVELEYRSTFEGYRPFTDQEVAPWRESNETVGRIGGWRAYAREAQGKPAEAGQPAPAAAPSGAGGHQEHH